MTSKIRFNPVTREVEIEGTEAFVEKYFKQIQDLFISSQQATEAPAARTARSVKPELKEPARRPSARLLKKGDIFNTVVDRIRESEDGMTTDALMKETGFTQQQVRSVIFRAEKQGVIHRSRRGVYSAGKDQHPSGVAGEEERHEGAEPQEQTSSDAETI